MIALGVRIYFHGYDFTNSVNFHLFNDDNNAKTQAFDALYMTMFAAFVSYWSYAWSILIRINEKFYIFSHWTFPSWKSSRKYRYKQYCRLKHHVFCLKCWKKNIHANRRCDAKKHFLRKFLKFFNQLDLFSFNDLIFNKMFTICGLIHV